MAVLVDAGLLWANRIFDALVVGLTAYVLGSAVLLYLSFRRKPRKPRGDTGP
jgi:hypothetical protein